MNGFTKIWSVGQWVLVGALVATPLWSGTGGSALAQILGSGATMRAFASEAELQAFLEKRRGAERYDVGADAAAESSGPAEGAAEVAADAGAPPPIPEPPQVAMPELVSPALPSVSPAAPGEARAPASITNVQTAGVDEGGIVKRHGDLLVVLRRGRLFSFDTRGGALRAVAAVNAFPGAQDASDAWYDEMLISGDTLLVIGYSYARQGTEVNRFRLSDDGKIAWRDTSYLRSSDYYSSRNYASRLMGDKLIFYAPLPLYDGDLHDLYPARADWGANGKIGAFRNFAGARDVYAPEPLWRDPAMIAEVMHSVMICDLGAGQGASAPMACTATNVLGGWSRSFYVSVGAVYVWTANEGAYATEDTNTNRAMLYRIPLDGAPPQAVEVAGMPLDQFSFREEGDGTLHVLTQAEGGGDAMWQAEGEERGDMALLTLAPGRFGNGAQAVTPADYRALPAVRGYERQNRFVGDWLLYAGGQVAQDLRKPGPAQASLYAVPLAGGDPVALSPGHGVTRLDRMGRDAVAIGQDAAGALTFSTITLGRSAALADQFRFPAAGEGENRSHAFFYRPDADDANGDSGLLGLPVMRSGNPGTRFLGSAAAILFLRRDRRALSLGGTLDARAGDRNDHCLASCTDWYGNARPIFFDSRIVALMGYELVEGQWRDGAIREVQRVDFTPTGQGLRR